MFDALKRGIRLEGGLKANLFGSMKQKDGINREKGISQGILVNDVHP